MEADFHVADVAPGDVAAQEEDVPAGAVLEALEVVAAVAAW